MDKADEIWMDKKRSVKGEAVALAEFRSFWKDIKKRVKTEVELAEHQRKCRPIKASAHRTANQETLQEELIRVNPDWADLIDGTMKCPSCDHGLLVPVTPLAEIEAKTEKNESRI